jgi:hypothetical protein
MTIGGTRTRVDGVLAPNLPRVSWNVRALAIAGWGLLGVSALLGQAIVRLTPVALEPLRARLLGPSLAALYVGWVCLAAYSEGYLGFQRGFSPRVVARAAYLAAHPTPLRILLAPAFCMSLFHASRRGLIAAWGILATMIGLVVIVHHTPQPWRGIVDGGVVVGLVWGQLAILYCAARVLGGRALSVRTNLPEHVR